MRRSVVLATFIACVGASASAQTINIAAIGDSAVAGTGVSSEDRYPSQLEAALRAKGLDVRVSNQGINGEVSAATARRAGGVGSSVDIVVYWNGCQNDRRHGYSIPACMQNGADAAAAVRAKGIAFYGIRPPVYTPDMHRNLKWTLGGEGKMMDFRDGRGPVPDGHFNRAGYAQVLRGSLAPIQKLVQDAQKKKKG